LAIIACGSSDSTADAAGDAEPSHVLLAQGMSAQDARSVVRVSLGLQTSAAGVDGFAAAFRSCVERLRTGALQPIAAEG